MQINEWTYRPIIIFTLFAPGKQTLQPDEQNYQMYQAAFPCLETGVLKEQMLSLPTVMCLPTI